MSDLGRELANLRRAAGLTQRQASLLLSYSKGYISQVETGHRRPSAWLERALRRLYRNKAIPSPTLGCEIARVTISHYEGTEFCPFCPDGDRLPERCPATCDPFKGRFCRLAQSCPCAQQANEERLEAFVKWKERRLRKRYTQRLDKVVHFVLQSGYEEESANELSAKW